MEVYSSQDPWKTITVSNGKHGWRFTVARTHGRPLQWDDGGYAWDLQETQSMEGDYGEITKGMSEKYRIGDYEFHTYEEYLAAQEDVKKIDFLTKELDITDPDVAVRLYTLIRKKEIVFRSNVGLSFSWYLTDVLAQNSQKLLEEKRQRTQQAQQGKKLGIAGCICILAAVLCLGYYGITLWQEHLESLEFEKLQNMQNLTGHVIEDPSGDTADGAGSGDGENAMRSSSAGSGNGIQGSSGDSAGSGSGGQGSGQDSGSAGSSDARKKQAGPSGKNPSEKAYIDPAGLTVLKKYKELYRQNHDLAGWLSVEGTDINYPVMQTGKKNPDYYLHYDFEKKESDHGSLFLDARNDFVNRDTNLIIYGHNMRDGTMFGGLKRFMDKDYFEQHQELSFDTIYEKAHYKLVAVCLSKVNYQDDYTFRYYNFLNAERKRDFQAFLANIQQLTVFDQTIDISYGDELLTLSTCNSYMQDGRLFLIAKKE